MHKWRSRSQDPQTNPTSRSAWKWLLDWLDQLVVDNVKENKRRTLMWLREGCWSMLWLAVRHHMNNLAWCLSLFKGWKLLSSFDTVLSRSSLLSQDFWTWVCETGSGRDHDLHFPVLATHRDFYKYIDSVQILHFSEKALCIVFFHCVAYLTWLCSGTPSAKSDPTNQH